MLSACQWSFCPSVQVCCVIVDCWYSMVSACQWSFCPSMQVSCVIVEVLVFHGQCLLVVLVSLCASKLCYSGGAGIPRVSACQWSLCPSVKACCVIVEVLVFHGLACQWSLCPSVQVCCVIVQVLVFHGQCLLVVLVCFCASMLCYSGGAGIPWLVLSSCPCVLLCK